MRNTTMLNSKIILRLVLVAVAFVASAGVCWAAEPEPLLGGGISQILDTGGIVMIIILVGSVVGLALAMERLVTLRRSALVPSDFVEEVKAATEKRDWKTLESVCNAGKGPLARILQAGFRLGRHDAREMERAMESRGRHEVVTLRRPVKPIAILATISPLLGLLGTILGMIATFNLLGDTSPADRVQTLAPGIGKALYTTAAGLCVAIPFVILYHVLTGRILRAASEWSLIGTDILASMSGPPVVAAGAETSQAVPVDAASADSASQAVEATGEAS